MSHQPSEEEERALEHASRIAGNAIQFYAQHTGLKRHEAAVALLSVLIGNLRWIAEAELKEALHALADVPLNGLTPGTPEYAAVEAKMVALRLRVESGWNMVQGGTVGSG